MKKVLVGVVVLVALFISGCSDTGVLTINNWSDYYLYYILGGDEDNIQPGYSHEYDWDLSTSIFGDEDKKVSLEVWGDYIFNEVYRKTIKPGSNAKIDVYANAGEIIIWNDSYSLYVAEVYISPSEDSEWGDNDLIGEIGPGEWVSWYVSPGSWDIKLVDDWGYEFVSFNNYINIGDTYTFYYDGFKKSSDPAAEKLANSQANRTITEDRVQQNDK
jgi:hypothetical protein